MPKKKTESPTYLIDDVWRASIAKAMEQNGITQAELSRQIGSSKGALADALSLKVGKPKSKLVPAIHTALGLPAPPASMKEPVPPAPAQRSPEERRRRFGWVDDDVLHLQIDGEKVKSAPPKDDE